MKEQGKLLIFPDAARFLREPKLPPSRKRKIIPFAKQGKLIDMAEYRARKEASERDPQTPA